MSTELHQYQLMPDLTPDEYTSLKADIAERGVQVPVEYDERGIVLDGHHRVRAALDLGLDWPSIVRVGMTEQEKRQHIWALNLQRRHLTKEQLREQWAAMRADGMTYQAIADTSGVSVSTVHDSVFRNRKTQPAVITGKDGKCYPATKKRKSSSVIVKNKRERTRAQTALDTTPAAVLPGTFMDVRRLARLAREHQAQEKAATVSGDVHEGTVSLLLGDMRERSAEIEPESVDLIFTDPPYPREYLGLWEDLGALAGRVLKPNGMLVAYTGAMYLPDVMTNLATHLAYWWCGAIELPGAHSRVYARNVSQCVKPLLFYTRPGAKPDQWVRDFAPSAAPEKDVHDWQQSLAPALYYIAKLCPPDGLVVDPFLGGGTTAVAAKQLGRDFVGIEIERAAFALANERISNAD